MQHRSKHLARLHPERHRNKILDVAQPFRAACFVTPRRDKALRYRVSGCTLARLYQVADAVSIKPAVLGPVHFRGLTA